MSKVLQSEFFKTGFWFSFFSFLLFNFFLYVSENGPHDCHAFHIVGFPFRFYQWGQFVWMEKVLWFGGIGNLIFGIIASVLLGSFRYWFMSRRVRLK